MRIFVIFLSPSSQMVEQYLNAVPVPFLAHHFQSVAHSAAKLSAVLFPNN
jgi:hypothetical protein